MKPYRIYDSWEESYFVKRLNRFTVLVKLSKTVDNTIIKAYLPNTGRLTEHLIPGNTIFITRNKTARFNFKVISTFYQGSFVFLDTVKLNELFKLFLSKNIKLIEGFKNPILLRREYAVKNHRIDFFISDYLHHQGLIEIKSCTLCHNQIAMFPDAPSKRALSNINLLSQLKNSSFNPWIIFLISHKRAEKFIPNFHTDPVFSRTLVKLNNLKVSAFRYKMIDPITVDLDSVTNIKIDFNLVKKHLTISGSYILVLENVKNDKIKIGKIGEIKFKKGFYTYVGSAMNGLDQRVKRHYKNKKNKRWHIDYITPNPMKIIKDFKIRRKDKIEVELAKDVMQISDGYIPYFGSSDSKLESHLFFFRNSPLQNQNFINTILNYQTFTEHIVK